MKEAFVEANSTDRFIETLEITHPTTSGDKALEAMIILDTSGSMGTEIVTLKTNIVAAFNQLLITYDSVKLGLISYGQGANSGQPIFQVDLTNDPTLIETALDPLVAVGGQEPVFDSIVMAVNQANWSPTDRYRLTKSILVLTDEGTSGYASTEQDAIDAYESENLVIHQSYTPNQASIAPIVRFQIATGGVYFNMNLNGQDFIDAFDATLVVSNTLDSGVTPFYIVQDVDGYDLTLEDGRVKTFEPVGFSLGYPGQNDQGLNELAFEVDNVDLRVSKFIDAVLPFRTPVIVKHRVYLASDLSAPQGGPWTYVLADAQMTSTKVTARASFADLINTQFLKINYRRDEFPSLGNT